MIDKVPYRRIDYSGAQNGAPHVEVPEDPDRLEHFDTETLRGILLASGKTEFLNFLAMPAHKLKECKPYLLFTNDHRIICLRVTPSGFNIHDYGSSDTADKEEIWKSRKGNELWGIEFSDWWNIRPKQRPSQAPKWSEPQKRTGKIRNLLSNLFNL